MKLLAPLARRASTGVFSSGQWTVATAAPPVATVCHTPPLARGGRGGRGGLVWSGLAN